MRAGFFSEQVRRLIEASTLEAGGLTCGRLEAQRTAPQLIGLLRRWPDVFSVAGQVQLPTDLVMILTDVWPLLSKNQREIQDPKRQVAYRAEAYSYRYEILQSKDPTKIRTFGGIDNSMGYDIEDTNTQPQRRIEVKGSRGQDIRFFMTANEWRVANESGASYEVQFWGCISLSRPADQEYKELLDKGYPVKIKNFLTSIKAGILSGEPYSYLVTVL
jgi:hypothetical protein